MFRLRTSMIMLLVIVISMLFVSCGGQEAAPAPEEATTAEEEAAPAEEEAAPAEEEAAPAEEEPMAEDETIDIVYIPKNTGNPYFDSIIGGFEKACSEIGCNFTTTAPATAEATSQIPFIAEQIQRGVDVLAISPNSPDALNDLFDEARAEGIVVLIVNSDIPGSEEHRDAAILLHGFRYHR